MGTNDAHELFERVPQWWSEPVFGLAVAFAGVLGMGLCWLVGQRVVGVTAGSALAYAGTLVLLALAYAAVGLGVTAAYLRYRGFDPGFVIAWPDREATRWVAGLVALGPALVWASTLLGSTAPDSTWDVPGAYVVAKPFGTVASPDGMSLLVAGALSILLIAGVVGPAVGALFHGVFQNSLRRVAPAGVAVGATAVAVAVLANGVDPVGTVVVAAVVAAGGYAYERTGNLAVPMAAYAVLNAVTLTTALLLVLSAAGVV